MNAGLCELPTCPDEYRGSFRGLRPPTKTIDQQYDPGWSETSLGQKIIYVPYLNAGAYSYFLSCSLLPPIFCAVFLIPE